MKKLLIGLMIISPVLFVGCASAPDNRVEIPLDSDPRIGEEVAQVCLHRDLDSWNNVDNDRKAVIIKMKNRDTYKLKLSGSCDPYWSDMRMVVVAGGGSNCFSRGDRIKTDGDPSQGHGSGCTISNINKWNPDAVKQAEQQPKPE